MKAVFWTTFRRISIAVALLTLTSSSFAADIAKEAWERTLSTKDSADEVSAITAAKVGEEDVIIIAGEVSAVRGEGIGLQGLVKGAGTANKTVDDNEEYVDGFVAQISAATKEVKWVYRYNAGEKYNVKSKYFDVAFDEASGHVFAVGHKKDLDTRMYVAVMTMLAVSGGELIKTVEYKSPSQASGNAHFSAVSLLNGGLYMCGTDTAGVKAGRKRLDSSVKVDGGLFFVRANAGTGEETWSRQSGKDRLRDRCSGIAPSSDGSTMYFATTEVSKASTGQKSQPTGQVVGYSLKTATGDLAWRSTLPRGANVQDTAAGIAHKDGAVFLSSMKWTDVYRGKRMFLYKLSGHTGQRLFAVETCCDDILSRIPGDFKGRGSAEPARGLFVGEDGFVYQFGSYKAREKSVLDSFASVVVRTSIFGDRLPGFDSSAPVEKYQYEASKPRMMASTAHNKGILAVELSGNLFGSNADAHNAKVIDVTLAPVEEPRRVRYRSKKGANFVQVSSRLLAIAQKNTPLPAFASVVADSLHLPSEQVVAHHDDARDETVITVFVYTDDTEGGKGGKDAAEMKQQLDKILGSSKGEASMMENILGLRTGALKVLEPSKVTGTGPADELGELSALDGSKVGQESATEMSEKRAEGLSATPIPKSENSGIPKKVLIGGIAGGGVALVALIAIIVAVAVR